MNLGGHAAVLNRRLSSSDPSIRAVASKQEQQFRTLLFRSTGSCIDDFSDEVNPRFGAGRESYGLFVWVRSSHAGLRRVTYRATVRVPDLARGHRPPLRTVVSLVLVAFIGGAPL
jgi:hypothetical protein